MYVYILFFLILSLSGCFNFDNYKKMEEKANVVLVNINNDLNNIEKSIWNLVISTQDSYKNKDLYLKNVDSTKYSIAENGVLYKNKLANKDASVWLSSIYANNNEAIEEAMFTENIDKTLQEIVDNNQNIVQSYFNSKHSLNRIYPQFDVISQYEYNLKIPELNFYYLADNKHNPSRKAVWIDEPYVDPAGRGWMISVIAPVYTNNDLHGVVGLDITIDKITEKYIKDNEYMIMIVDKNGVLVTSNNDLYQIFGLPIPENYRYIDSIKQDTYRKSDYSLNNSKNKDVRLIVDKLLSEKTISFDIGMYTHNYKVYTNTIEKLGWKIIIVKRS